MAGRRASSADDIPFDPQRIVDVLDRHGVRCLVVGGIAATIHGAQRPTSDFDVVADYATTNLERLAAAMRELNARIRTEGYLDEATRAASAALLHPDFIRRSEISTWSTDAGNLDVLRDIPDARGQHRDYADLLPTSAALEGMSVVVRVAGLDDIIASKEWAARPKDHAAVRELRQLRAAPTQPATAAGRLRGRPRPGGLGDGR